MVSLNELDNLTVDIEVAAPEDYVDAGLNQLPPEGTYDLVIKEWSLPRDRETGEYVTNRVVLDVVEIIDAPAGAENWVGRNVYGLTVFTTTYLRNGVKVSGLGDLIRGIDETAKWSNIREAGEILTKASDERLPFRAKLQWESFDLDHYSAMGGKSMVRKSDEEKALRKASTVKGMRNFRQAPDGTYLPETLGPSGDTLEARLVIDRVIPANKVRR